VLDGDATKLLALLKAHYIERLAMVVSSIPIIWFPTEPICVRRSTQN